MDCDERFDQWYATQAHQLANESLCRLIWRRGWEAAAGLRGDGDDLVLPPGWKFELLPTRCPQCGCEVARGLRRLETQPKGEDHADSR